jgi:hypothetical protein
MAIVGLLWAAKQGGLIRISGISDNSKRSKPVLAADGTPRVVAKSQEHTMADNLVGAKRMGEACIDTAVRQAVAWGHSI